MPLTILLIVAKEGRSCDLRVVYRQVRSAIAVTRKQIDMLEREGLVARIGDPHDRRALRVRLTASGRKAFRAMAEAHERWIVDALSVLDRAQMSQLGDLLGTVKAHVAEAKEKGQ